MGSFTLRSYMKVVSETSIRAPSWRSCDQGQGDARTPVLQPRSGAVLVIRPSDAARSGEGVEIGVERGRCVRRSDRVVKVIAIESICLNQDAVGNEALERHSEALHIGRCGGRAVRHVRDVSNIRLAASAVNGDQTSTVAQMLDRAERRRRQRPQAVRNARSERSEER